VSQWNSACVLLHFPLWTQSVAYWNSKPRHILLFSPVIRVQRSVWPWKEVSTFTVNKRFVASVSRNEGQWWLSEICEYICRKQWQEGINKRYFRLSEEGSKNPSTNLLNVYWKVRVVRGVVKSMTAVNHYVYQCIHHHVKWCSLMRPRSADGGDDYDYV
jgi:hypothetical protein